jgi:hypothetical protein
MNPHTHDCLVQLGSRGASCQCHALDRLADFAYTRAHPTVHTDAVHFAAAQPHAMLEDGDGTLGQPFGHKISERSAADRHFARIVHDIVRGKSARALKRLVRNAHFIRSAPDFGPGRASKA